MKMATRIQKKPQLRKALHEGNFDEISVGRDGSWANTGTGYGGEQDGKNPVTGIKRSRFYDVTHKDISEKFAEIEEFLNSSFLKEVA
jgi:hypothetical protein